MEFKIPDRIGLAVPDAPRLAQLRENLTKSTTPIRPLPSNLAMMLMVIVVFAVLAIVLTVPVGFNGFAKLTPAAAALEYSVILLLALALAGSVLEHMIPGARRTMAPLTGILLAIVLLSVTAALQFPVFDSGHFVQRGIPCLRLGTLCAIPAGAAVWGLLRRGFVLSPNAAAVAGGSLAGLLGVGVLALHCPIFESGHIIIWHVGVMVVTSVCGACIGWIAGRAG